MVTGEEDLTEPSGESEWACWYLCWICGFVFFIIVSSFPKIWRFPKLLANMSVLLFSSVIILIILLACVWLVPLYVGSIPSASSSSLTNYSHKSSFSGVHCLFFSLLYPASCAWMTAVKHSLISSAIFRRTPNEKILPTFSFLCYTAQHKCWQETAVPSLTFYRALWTHTISITGRAFESAESGIVWRNLMTHIASILALHSQAARCTICPLF